MLVSGATQMGLKILEDLTAFHTKTPLSYQFSSRKIAVVVSGSTIPYITDSSTYSDLRSICLSMGLVPIAFAKTEKRTVYNMMTALGIKKIVLNLKASGDDVYFNSNGLLSHFASKLSSVLSNDAKKEACHKCL